MFTTIVLWLVSPIFTLHTKVHTHLFTTRKNNVSPQKHPRKKIKKKQLLVGPKIYQKINGVKTNPIIGICSPQGNPLIFGHFLGGFPTSICKDRLRVDEVFNLPGIIVWTTTSISNGVRSKSQIKAGDPKKPLVFPGSDPWDWEKLPAFSWQQKYGFHVGKYTSPIDPTGFRLERCLLIAYFCWGRIWPDKSTYCVDLKRGNMCRP